MAPDPRLTWCADERDRIWSKERSDGRRNETEQGFRPLESASWLSGVDVLSYGCARSAAALYVSELQVQAGAVRAEHIVTSDAAFRVENCLRVILRMNRNPALPGLPRPLSF